MPSSHVDFSAGSTLYAILIGLMLMVAFWGWGSILTQMATDKDRFGVATTACLGIGVFLAACGILEICQIASSPLFWAFTAVGVLVAVLNGRHWSQTMPRLDPAAKIIIAVLILVQIVFVINIAGWRFDNVDDLQGYLVMPERILQIGSTGRDPFMFRRLEAGLGGTHYVFALYLAFLDFTHLRIADLGVGGALLGLGVASHARQSPRGARWLPLLLAVALVVTVCTPIANLTPDVLAIALFYSALQTALGLIRTESIEMFDHILLGILLFAMVCLRSTYISPAVALYGTFYMSLFLTRDKVQVLQVGLAVGALILILAAPWMLVAERIAGTPLYPFLGFGTLSHDEVIGNASAKAFLRSFILLCICYSLAVGSAWAIAQSRRSRPGVSLFAALLTILMVLLLAASQMKFTVFAYRYSYVGLTAVPVFLFVESFHHSPLTTPWRVLRFGPPMALALFLLVLMRGWPDTFRNGQISALAGLKIDKEQLIALPINASDPQQRAALLAGIRAMQAAVPPGQLILARLDAPFLLDFRRNPIWVMDHPGQMGPPPGVPDEATVAAWRTYLGKLDVPFVAYAYGNEAGDSVALSTWFMNGLAGPSYWEQKLADKTAAIQAMLLKLRGESIVVFDDGNRYVARLASSP